MKKIVLTAEQAELEIYFRALMNNGTIRCKCSEKIIEAILIAGQHGLLGSYQRSGMDYSEVYTGIITSDTCPNNFLCYVIDPDTIIEIAEPETWFQKEQYIFCDIAADTNNEDAFLVHFPTGDFMHFTVLGMFKCKGFTQIGYWKKTWKNAISNIPNPLIDKDGELTVIEDSSDHLINENRAKQGVKFDIASHTVWQKNAAE